MHTAYGLHPWAVLNDFDVFDIDEFNLLLDKANPVAVGEIGLDFKVDVDRVKQMDIFVKQLDLARDRKLPALLHCRGAFDEMLHILKNYQDVTLVVHAFTRGVKLAERFLDLGSYLAFGGAATRDKAKQCRQSIKYAPEDRILFETDAPSIGLDGVEAFDTEPCHVHNIAKAVAKHRGVSFERIAERTSENARRVFKK